MDEFTPAVPLKQCSRKEKCINSLGSWLPETRQYFYPNKRARNGLQSSCIVCSCASNRRSHTKHADRVRERNRRYEQAHPDKVRAWSKASYHKDIEKSREYRREYRQNHLEERRAYDRKYWSEHPKERLEKQRRSVSKNSEKHKETCRNWVKNNPDKQRERRRRRRSLERNLPSNFPPNLELRMHEYWGGKCAICGATAGLWTFLAADHWIALTDERPDNPGTVATNMIPLCHSKKGVPAGTPSCNGGKWNKDPLEWLISRFGKRKANQILKRVTDYFDWTRLQDSEVVL